MALPLQLQEHAVFASYCAAGNEDLVAFLLALSEAPQAGGCWLWGQPLSGKSHLLQAVCAAAADRAAYLPLRYLHPAGPAMLEGMASRQIVCIDDVNLVAGDARWEQELFSLCNQISDHGGTLVVAAPAAPRDSGIQLRDLASRFSQLAVFNVHPLDDAQRILAMQLRAQHKGLDLPDDTAAYMLKRSRRDLVSLLKLLDRVDLAALEAQRRLTIPFVREVMSNSKAAD